MFMGFVKSVAGRSGGGGGGAPTAAQAYGGNQPAAGTGDAAIDGFIAQWGLDAKAQSALCSLDPATQQRVMSDFHPTDVSRANQMFMGFVKSVGGRSGGGAPTAAQAYGNNQPAAQTGNADIDGFVGQWGLDAKAQSALLSLDPETQLRVISGFRPTDMSRANQMFMGFVKSLTGGKGGNRFSPY
mmetsp:Transcript_18875/g.34207  ORF Transcript_18875/g.34207 Transcript_18875/m.34207 type:complete len:185 (-) Transcript_18875:41-595(-)